MPKKRTRHQRCSVGLLVPLGAPCASGSSRCLIEHTFRYHFRTHAFACALGLAPTRCLYADFLPGSFLSAPPWTLFWLSVVIAGQPGMFRPFRSRIQQSMIPSTSGRFIASMLLSSMSMLDLIRPKSSLAHCTPSLRWVFPAMEQVYLLRIHPYTSPTQRRIAFVSVLSCADVYTGSGHEQQQQQQQ